jgi:hypothetical protein
MVRRDSASSAGKVEGDVFGEGDVRGSHDEFRVRGLLGGVKTEVMAGSTGGVSDTGIARLPYTRSESDAARVSFVP